MPCQLPIYGQKHKYLFMYTHHKSTDFLGWVYQPIFDHQDRQLLDQPIRQ